MCVFAPSSNHKVLLPLTTLCLFHDCVLRRPCHKWDQECLMRTNRHCRDNVTVFALASNFSSNNVAKVVLYSIFLLDKKDSSGGRCKFAHLFDPPVAVDQRSTRTNVACCVRLRFWKQARQVLPSLLRLLHTTSSCHKTHAYNAHQRTNHTPAVLRKIVDVEHVSSKRRFTLASSKGRQTHKYITCSVNDSVDSRVLHDSCNTQARSRVRCGARVLSTHVEGAGAGTSTRTSRDTRSILEHWVSPGRSQP